MGSGFSVNCCAPERNVLCSSFAFLWTFVGRDKGLDGQPLIAASSSSGSPTYRTIVPPVAHNQVIVEEQPTFGERRAERAYCSFANACRRGNPKHFVDESHPGDPDYQDGAAKRVCVAPGAQLAPRDGTFDWIRNANDKADREARAATATLTLKACHGGFYQLGNAAVELRQVEKLLRGTQILTLEEVKNALKSNGSSPPRLSVAAEATALAAALHLAAKGRSVAVVGAASAYHPCGGFRTGGRHALEEAMCVQSSLCVSLQRAVWLSRYGDVHVPIPERLHADGRKDWFCYIPERGAILSPCVEVFRSGSGDGYAFLKKPVELAAVVSVAMPNKNAAVKDSPLDAPPDVNAYKALLSDKLKVALGSAVLAGATTVVVPGVGCGVFKNEPGDVGAALADAMRSLGGGLQEVVLAGVPRPFAAAAAEGLNQSL